MNPWHVPTVDAVTDLQFDLNEGVLGFHTNRPYWRRFYTPEGSESVAQAFEKAAERMEASDG